VYTEIFWEKMKERYHLEDSGVEGKILLRWIFRKCDVRA
jgi:hypothetical protein